MALSRASIVEQKTATMVRKFLFIFVNLKLLILRLKIVNFRGIFRNFKTGLSSWIGCVKKQLSEI